MLCIGSALVGFLLIVAPKTALFDAYNRTIAEALYSGVPMTLEAREHNAWLLATVGAGTVGWALSQFWIVLIPFQRREKWAHDCLCVSTAVWITLDIGIAAWFGVGGELAFVVPVAVLLAIPLIVTRPAFTEGKRLERIGDRLVEEIA